MSLVVRCEERHLRCQSPASTSECGEFASGIPQVSRLHAVVDECTTSYEEFDFGAVGRVAYDFFWSDFADW